MGRLSKHLGEGIWVDIDGEKYLLKPLGTEELPNLLKVMKNFGHLKEDSAVEDVLKGFTDESMNSVRSLIDKTLEISLPEEPEEDRKCFGMKYMMVLLPKIFEINQPPKSIEEEKKEELLERLNASKSAQKKKE